MMLKHQQKKTFDAANTAIIKKEEEEDKKALNLLNIGNASEIGQRDGERNYEPVGEQREYE